MAANDPKDFRRDGASYRYALRATPAALGTIID
jgi:hypothetical protein